MIIFQVPLYWQSKKKEKTLKISTNKIYAGVHWGTRKNIKDRIARHAAGFCQTDQEIKSFPVEICYRYIFASRPLDTLNCAFMSKMFEDALVSLNIIPDDSPQYVARTIIEVLRDPSKKKKKKTSSLGSKEDQKNRDHLIITINPWKI